MFHILVAGATLVRFCCFRASGYFSVHRFCTKFSIDHHRRKLVLDTIDMLQIGSAMLSADEAKTHFAAWCVASAPLILGYNLADKSASARAEQIAGNMAAISKNWQHQISPLHIEIA
eukprot:SAG31_NODE_1500_length_8090_cov_10.522588_4_plen_117_part_00